MNRRVATTKSKRTKLMFSNIILFLVLKVFCAFALILALLPDVLSSFMISI